MTCQKETEYRIPNYERILSESYPDGMSDEHCRHCDAEVKVPAVLAVHGCPNCGAQVIPCHFCLDTHRGCLADCLMQDAINAAKVRVTEVDFVEAQRRMIYDCESSFMDFANCCCDDHDSDAYKSLFENQDQVGIIEITVWRMVREAIKSDWRPEETLMDAFIRLCGEKLMELHENLCDSWVRFGNRKYHVFWGPVKTKGGVGDVRN